MGWRGLEATNSANPIKLNYMGAKSKILSS
jgi:hypothetical protein